MRRFEHFTGEELKDIKTGLIVWQTAYSNRLHDSSYPNELRKNTMEFILRLQKLIEEIRKEEFTERMP